MFELIEAPSMDLPSSDLETMFRYLRFSETNHLGCGDIRLTLGQQEEIIETVAEIKRQREDLLEALEMVKHKLGAKPALSYFETDVLFARVVAALKRNGA